MPSRQHSEPEEVNPPPLLDLPGSVPAPRQPAEVKSQVDPNTLKIRDGWSLLEVLLDSPAKTRTFLGMFAFFLVTAAAAGGLTVGILLLLLPRTPLASNWLWPIGAGGAANLALLVRAWLMVHNTKEQAPAKASRKSSPRRSDPES